MRRIDQGEAPSAGVLAGAAIYNPLVLAFYDGMVMGLANPLAWKCPTRSLLAWYEAHVSSNHLDVGVGTGYFLDRCRFPTDAPRIVLADLNPNSLRKTARRVRRYRPTAYQLDVLSPFRLPEEPFESIGMNYLLHCLPGRISEKAIAFDHLLPLLKPGGVLFGSTILSVGVEPSFWARGLLGVYNRMHVINNAEDALSDLESCLRARFSRIELRVVGSVALFSAT
jgi:SAM-dependent methyltransferase